ncbi:MAG: hypothetical protein HZB53_15200 [Chloroflexi bacterium]|nr:hypothetical protein [Chloroflexota bacterium]
MASKKKDAIPEQFATIAEASEFWDSHDLADYWDQTNEAQIDVDIKRRKYLAALEPQLAKKIAARARQQGVSTETLINVWLAEKVLESERGR